MMEASVGVFMRIRIWWALKVGTFKLKLVNRYCTQYGLVPVRMVTKAGTDYLVAGDGSLHKIGRRQEKA